VRTSNPTNQKKSVHEFQDPQQMCDFGFPVKITGHLNKFNCRLQGKDKLIHAIYDSIKGFQMKHVLREHQLKINNYSHFQTLAEVYRNEVQNSKYSNCNRTLFEKF
jgi:hypothetical protein